MNSNPKKGVPHLLPKQKTKSGGGIEKDGNQLGNSIPNCHLNSVTIFNDAGLIRYAEDKLRMIEEQVHGVTINRVETVNLGTLFESGDPDSAADCAAKADIIFLALNVTHLPDNWKNWFWQWACLREEKDIGLLACIFGGLASGWFGGTIREFFEGVAREGRMQLMYHTPELEDTEAGSKATWEFLDRR